jgi:hypothetical protein
LIALFVLAPMIRLWPSTKDRQAMRGRMLAMKRGVGVELTMIDDPVPDQDKYRTPSGLPLPTRLRVIAFRARHKQLVDEKMRPADWVARRVGAGANSRSMPQGVQVDDWRLSFEAGRAPKSVQEAQITDQIRLTVARLPASVVMLDWANRALSAYWEENGREEEVTLICDLLDSLLEAHRS